MTSQNNGQAKAVRAEQVGLPPPKWWGQFVSDGNPPRRRFLIRWKRVLGVAACVLATTYLSLATALWGYYSFYRKVPGVRWADVAVLPRFSNVQAAIGAKYYSDAKDLWNTKQYGPAIFTARAAVLKSPGNLEARAFLSKCWRELGRVEDSLRTLQEGVRYSASDPRFQRLIIERCMETGRFTQTIKLLREDLPVQGVNLLERSDSQYRLIEVKAVFEAEGAPQAAQTAARYSELQSRPEAIPLLARIESAEGRGDDALRRLGDARKLYPSDEGILSTEADMAKGLGRLDEAKDAAQALMKAHPNSTAAQLCFIEMFGSRKGSEVGAWMASFMYFVRQHRHDPDAMAQLASLAASQGWADVDFLLYENSLHENLSGMPYAVYYAAGLLKSGDVAGADSVWHQLSITNSQQLDSASYVGAMIAQASGRDSEATQIIGRLRRDTANDPARRQTLETLFKEFGFPNLAAALGSNSA
jgi:tetratricopeptide (TPR) repeat protein